jgi:hypothetical protein
MKRIMFFLATTLLVLTASLTPAESPKVSKFTIDVEHLADGLSLKCSDGCAWKTLTIGGCVSGKPCHFVLDQNGMKGPLPPE